MDIVYLTHLIDSVAACGGSRARVWFTSVNGQISARVEAREGGGVSKEISLSGKFSSDLNGLLAIVKG